MDVRGRHIRNIFSENNSKTRVQMPVDVAVKEPRAGVVGFKADGDLITCAGANAYNVALYRVDEVVGRAVRATNNVERML